MSQQKACAKLLRVPAPQNCSAFPPQPRAQKLAGAPLHLHRLRRQSWLAGETDAEGDEATGALARNFYTSMSVWEIRIDPSLSPEGASRWPG